MMNTIVEQTGTNLNLFLTKSILKKFPHLYYVCHFKHSFFLILTYKDLVVIAKFH